MFFYSLLHAMYYVYYAAFSMYIIYEGGIWLGQRPALAWARGHVHCTLGWKGHLHMHLWGHLYTYLSTRSSVHTLTTFWECLDVFNDTWGLDFLRLKDGKQMNLTPQTTACLLSCYKFQKDKHKQPFSACRRWLVFSNPKAQIQIGDQKCSWALGKHLAQACPPTSLYVRIYVYI